MLKECHFLRHLSPAWIESNNDGEEAEFIKRQIVTRRRLEQGSEYGRPENIIYSNVIIWRVDGEILSLDVNTFISLYLRARQLPEQIQKDPLIHQERGLTLKSSFLFNSDRSKLDTLSKK